MKLSKLKQVGIYEKNGIKYHLEILSSPTRMLMDFYEIIQKEIDEDDFLLQATANNADGERILRASVFKTFNDKPITEVYGDEKIFMVFEQDRLVMKFSDDFDAESKSICLTEYGPKSQQVKTKDDQYQHITYIDTMVVEEKTECELYKLDLKTTDLSYGKQINKHKTLTYTANSNVVEYTATKSVVMRSLSEIAIEKDLSYLQTKKYVFVETIEEFDALVDRLNFVNKPIAFDTETTGLNVNRFPEGFIEPSNKQERAKLVGLCIAYEEGTGYYIPVRSSSPTYRPLDLVYVLKRLKKILETKHLVTHNGSYDWKVMWTFGININIVDDTYLLQYLIDVKQAKAVKKLKVMAERLLGHETVELEDFFPKIGKKKQRITFDLLPKISVKAYGPADADFTLSIRNILINRLPDDMRFIYGQEIKLMKNLALAEYYGFRLDMDKLEKYTEECEIMIVELEKQIYMLAGKTEDSGFNIASGDQLSKLLYEELQYPVLVKIKGSEKASTDKKAMKALSKWEKKEGKGPLAKTILEYKKQKKLLTAFYYRLAKDNMGGYVFPKYNQAGTESGRVAGYNPNLQQIDNMIKDLFVSDGPDWKLFDADYAQIEYRVMASLAREAKLIEQFKDPDADFHIMMAALLFGVSENDVTSAMRKASKALNFGIPYGMGDESLAEGIHGEITPEFVEDARLKKEAYYTSVPNVRDMFISIKNVAFLQGFTETFFKRRRHYPKIRTGTRKEQADAKRQAGNTYIQGSAADILKIAYNRVMSLIEKRYGLPVYENILDGTNEVPETPLVRVSANIHDEMLGNFHSSVDVFELIRLIKKAMEYSVSTSVAFTPIFAGISICDNWAQGKSDDFEMPVRMTDEIAARVENGTLKQTPGSDPTVEVRNYIDDFQRRRLIKFFDTELGYTKQVDKKEYINFSVVKASMKDWKTARVITKYFPWGINAEGHKIEFNDFSKDQLEAYKDKMFDDQLRYFISTEYGQDSISYAEVSNASDVSQDMFDDSEEELSYMVDDLDDILDEDAMDEYGAGEVIDIEAYRKLSRKGKEIVTETVVQDATCNLKQSRLVVFDRKYNFILTGISVPDLTSFLKFLKENENEFGYEAFIHIGDKVTALPFNVNVMSRDRIFSEMSKYVTDTNDDEMLREAN